MSESHFSESDVDIATLRQWQSESEHNQVLQILQAVQPGQGYISILKAISLVLSGEIETGAQYLETEFEPATAEQWCDVALAELLRGSPEVALGAIIIALEMGNEEAVAFGRKGAICLALNDLEASREAYQEAILRAPGQAEWHNNLAGILLRQQKLEDALENYQLALRLNKNLEQALRGKQQILFALDRMDEVIEQLQVSLQKAPDNLDLRLRLVQAYAQDNQLQEAIKLLQYVLYPPEEVDKPETLETLEANKTDTQKIWEQQLRCRNTLVNLYNQYDRPFLALTAVDQLLALQPENPLPFLRQKIEFLVDLSRYEEAEQLLNELDQEYPDQNPLLLAKATLYTETERYIEAEKIQRDLLETYPGDAGLMSQLGQTLLWLGQLDEAAELFEQASSVNPMALAQMVNAKRIPETEDALARMAQIADNPMLADPGRITMSFALAEVYDKKKNYDKAFHYLAQANKLSDKTLSYSCENFAQQVNDTIKVFNHSFMQQDFKVRLSDRTPIFVVGMPRSGTTLTEQILCSHPSIFGAGELPFMSKLTRLMPRVLKSHQAYPYCLEKVSTHIFEEAARFYLHSLQAYDTEHHYVVDKMPHNFMHVGLIHLVFPGAKIIHIQRDPRDTALSNFQQNFKAKHGGLGYAFNLQKIAEEINSYYRMIKHWRTLKIPMFELVYEEMVNNQETVTAELLQFVGVDWNDNVTAFHKTERAVRTASVSQVRQPIYQTSKQKWRNYEPYLQLLLDNLDPEVTQLWEAKNE